MLRLDRNIGYMKRFLKGSLCLILFIGVGIVSFMLVKGCLINDKSEEDFDLKNSFFSEESVDNDEKIDNASNGAPNSEAHTISDVVDNVMPSIVAITSKSTYTANDIFFGKYETESIQAGSGIIISYNNQSILVVTNNHVVENSDDITITFFDDSIVRGSVKGADAVTDLAVISINKEDVSEDTFEKIRVASLGNTEGLRVGETVIAVGNAMGYGNSVTIGILSAKDREIDLTDNASMKLLQTDAAINPGNSGGALINLKGEVIGINSIKYVSTDTERVGYAIPIDIAVPILNELINYEEINEEDRGYLGITGRDVTDAFAIRFDAPYGVYVYEVDEDSPAQKAEVLTGDIIVAFNGRKITKMNEMSDILKYKRAGDVCKLDIYRFKSGEYVKMTIEVELGKK